MGVSQAKRGKSDLGLVIALWLAVAAGCDVPLVAGPDASAEIEAGTEIAAPSDAASVADADAGRTIDTPDAVADASADLQGDPGADGAADADAASDAASDAATDPSADEGYTDAADAQVEVDADADADAGPTLPVAGLLETARLDIASSPEGSPHLGELAVDGDRIYVANSFAGVTALQHNGQGAMLVTSSWTGIPSKPRCTTISVHRPSQTLYCATPAYGANGVPSGAVSAYGLELPGSPLVRDALALVQPGAAFADLEVVEGALYLAAFDAGLMRAPIGADGALGAAVATGIGSHAVAVTHAGTQLALLDLDEGLVLATHSGAGVLKTGALAMDGPLLDVSVRGERAAVALGSAGVAVVDISGAQPLEVAHLTPRGVAVSVALGEGALAVGCLSGLYLYDLGVTPPALRGFVPAHQVMLDVAWAAGGIVASDWGMVFAARPDLAGSALIPDSDRGGYVRPKTDSTLRLANPGLTPLDVVATGVAGKTLAATTLAPQSEQDLTFPASLNPTGAPLSVQLATAQATLASAGPLVPRDIVLLKRRGDHDPATGRPAVGDAFPRLRVSAYPSGDPLDLPLPGVRQRVVGHADDCVAMWPQLRDLDWLASQGLSPDGAQVVALAARGKNLPQFVAQWRLNHITHATHDAPSGILLLDSGDITYGPTLYSDVLFLGQWPGGAHHPSDYVVDEGGVVRGIERLYRGAWPLRPAL
jgi:hypothetical protein